MCFLSCGKVKQIDTSGMKEIMRNSKVKRVTEKQLLEAVSIAGESVREKLNGNYRVECQHVYEMEGHRVELYATGLVSEEAGGDVKGQLLEAYKYGIENGQHPGVNIQKLNDTLYAYSFPLEQQAYLKTICGNDFVLVMISRTVIVKQL